MDDLKKMLRQSQPLFSFVLVILIIVTIVTKNIGYALGWVYGSAIGMLVYFVNIKMVDLIILKKSKWGVLLLMLKLPIYAIGLLPGVYFKLYPLLVTSFLALMLPKYTIYWTTFRERRKHE
ncbi:MAG TPA: hypothetical protein DCQ45_07115 [Erysipelotrichaceae bacterium]|nr:hypothetical protein [Erysipelotrichaceae bacterium]